VEPSDAGRVSHPLGTAAKKAVAKTPNKRASQGPRSRFMAAPTIPKQQPKAKKKAKAQPVRSIVRSYFVPKHGSWLNMAEIEIGVLRAQCIDRRFDNVTELEAEVAEWETQRNAAKATIEWTFIHCAELPGVEHRTRRSASASTCVRSPLPCLRALSTPRIHRPARLAAHRSPSTSPERCARGSRQPPLPAPMPESGVGPPDQAPRTRATLGRVTGPSGRRRVAVESARRGREGARHGSRPPDRTWRQHREP